jgi:hypothetical protein
VSVPYKTAVVPWASHGRLADNLPRVRWRLRFLSAATLAVALAVLALAGVASARPVPQQVPNSTLPGAGAFEGPVYTVPVDGIRLGYRQFGRGPDLLMVTGDTAAMSLWNPLSVTAAL